MVASGRTAYGQPWSIEVVTRSDGDTCLEGHIPGYESYVCALPFAEPTLEAATGWLIKEADGDVLIIVGLVPRQAKEIIITAYDGQVYPTEQLSLSAGRLFLGTIDPAVPLAEVTAQATDGRIVESRSAWQH